MVTVRKVEESLQDVPLSVTALSSKTLERANVLALADVANLTPGLIYQDFNVGALATPVIRGLAQSNIQGRENNVGMFLDGVYLTSRNNLDLELLDLQRVEVVKGPQSALYGRSTFGGAINYVTKPPADELDLKVTASAGSDEYYDTKVNVSGPLTDTLSATAALAYREFDGTINNIASKDNLGGYENSSAVVKLQWKPSDRFTGVLTAYYTDKETESSGIFNIAADCGNNGFGGATYVCGTLPFAESVSVDPRAKGAEADTTLIAMDLQYDFGEVTLTSITSYTDTDWSAVTDYDADATGVAYNTLNPAGAANINTFSFSYSEDETFSQEFRLAGGGDTFNWLAGVYWTSEEGETANAVSIDAAPLLAGQVLAPVLGFFNPNPYLTLNPLTPNSIPTRVSADVDIYAVFARGEWNIDERSRLSLEGRYTYEDKKVNGISSFVGAPSGKQANDWSYFAPRLSYDYKLNESVMLYGSLAAGTKSGGFNTSYSALYPQEQFYDEETNITYEIGSKGSFLDGRLNYDVAVFYIDWDDMQISGPSQDPLFFGSLVTNAGAATSRGLELQLNGVVTDWLQAGGGYAYVDPKFDDGVIDLSIASLCGDGSLCSTDVGGQQIGRTVKHQLNLFVDVSAPLTGNWDWYARADYFYRDEQPVRSANLQFVDSWSIFDARVGVSNDRWDVSLWAKNLFDEGYATSQIRQPALNNFSSPTTVIEGNTRQVAVTVSYRM